MKFIKLVTISFIIFSFVIGSTNAAKENFDRTKKHNSLKEKIEKECGGDKENCKEIMKETKKKMKRERMEKKKSKGKAAGYNSSRSNKEGIKADDNKNDRLGKRKQIDKATPLSQEYEDKLEARKMKREEKMRIKKMKMCKKMKKENCEEL